MSFPYVNIGNIKFLHAVKLFYIRILVFKNEYKNNFPNKFVTL